MRSSRFLAVGTQALIAPVAIAGCGQVTTPAQQGALARAQPTPLRTAHIEGRVERLEFTAPARLCAPWLVAEVPAVVVGAHGDARWNTPDGGRPFIATDEENIGQGSFLYTPALFSSFMPLRMHGLRPDSAFLTIGGRVGQESNRMQGYPQLPGAGGR
jgi:hypothetical protein